MPLKQSTFSAGRWTATSAFIRSGLQVLQIAVLARLLMPADFGLMAIAGSILTIFALFADIGLSRAIIHFEDASADALSSLYWLNLLMGIVLSLALAAVAPLINGALALPGLTAVLLAISPYFILSAIGQQFCALAEKQFRFSTVASNEILSSIVGFIVAIVIALYGGGVYALISSVLTTAFINSMLAWLRLSKGHRPRCRLHVSECLPFLRFGGYLVGEGLVNALIRQADIFVAGMVSNPSSLGIYSLPRDLSLRVGLVINPVITRVGFPVMSRLQGNLVALRSVYLQTLRMSASVSFPLYVALGLFANEVVAFLYGPHWKDAGMYLRILSAWGLIRSAGNPVSSLLHAVGAVKSAFWWNIGVLAILPSLYWVAASEWGLRGLAIGLLVTHIGLIFPAWRFLVRPHCGATISQYLRQLAIPLLLSLAAGSVAWLATRGVPHGTLRLAVGALTGGISYLGLSFVFNRAWIDAMWQLLRLPSNSMKNNFCRR